MEDTPKSGKEKWMVALGIIAAIAVLYLIFRNRSGGAQVIQTGNPGQASANQNAQLQASIANKQLNVSLIGGLMNMLFARQQEADQTAIAQGQIAAQQNVAALQVSHDVQLAQIGAGVQSQQTSASRDVALAQVGGQLQLGLRSFDSQDYQAQLAADVHQSDTAAQERVAFGGFDLQKTLAQISSDLQSTLAQFQFRSVKRIVGGATDVATLQAQTQQYAIQKQAETQQQASEFNLITGLFQGVMGFLGGFI